MRKIKKSVYRSTLLTLLGATRAVARLNVKPPTKWLSFLEGLQASSDMLHVKLSDLDEEVEKEFIEKEELLEMKLGKKNFYDEKELQELKERQEEIDIRKPRF